MASNRIVSPKASRNIPDTRNKTSTRGRPRRLNGKTRKSTTRPDTSSQTGSHPHRHKACAMSSPPVRILEVPQTTKAILRGYSPCSCRCRSINWCAMALPQCQAVCVGTARGSIAKKVSTGWQDIDSTASRCSGWARRNELSAQAIEQTLQLVFTLR